MDDIAERGMIKSVAKAVQVMDLLAQNGSAMALGEIAEKLGWAKSTTHGILSTLVSTSMLEQAQSDGRYSLGIRLFELGCAVSSSWNITSISQVHLQQLAVASGESAFLAVMDGLETVLLDTAMITGNYRIVSPAGTRSPLYCSSHGKVLLAYRQQKDCERLIKKMQFTKFTPHTIDNAAALQKSCDEIRARGFCIEKGEYRMGLCSVSAPVFDVNGEVRYAVGVVGMFRDTHSSEFGKVVEAVMSSASAISYEMGYRPGRRLP